MGNFLTEYQINFWERILAPAFEATFQMVAITTVFGTIFGFLVAVILLMTDKDGIHPNKYIYGLVIFLVNVVRSFPFLILMVFLLPFTKFVMGTSIGVKAAVVPLIIAATAFIAKLIENAMQEVDKGLIEAMKSFGLSETQIVFKVMLSEAMPAIISGVILPSEKSISCGPMYPLSSCVFIHPLSAAATSPAASNTSFLILLSTDFAVVFHIEFSLS